MSKNAMRTLKSLVARPSPNWGSALSKLGSAFALEHGRKKNAQAKAASERQITAKRKAWASALGSGVDVRALAASDPDFIADTKFQEFWQSSAPAPEAERFEDVMDEQGNIIGQRGPDNRFYDDPRAAAPEEPAETFETVQDPFGRGGVGQRSSTSGKVVGYQGPVAEPQERQRQIRPGPDGLDRYVGTGELVFPNVEAPEAEPEPITFDTESKARKEWKGESRVYNDTQDSVRRVVSSASRKTAAGDLAMIFNYMKVLDPGSVVREGEFATAQNTAGVPDRIRAQYNRVVNGERLTVNQRQDFVATAGGLFMGQVEQQRRKRSQFEQAFTARGLNPKSTLIDYVDEELVAKFSAREAAAISPMAQGPAPGPEAFTPTSAPAQGPPALPGRVGNEATDLILGASMPTAGGLPDTFRATSAPTPYAQGPQADPARVSMYQDLPPAALERQVATIASNPDQYSDAEKAAAAIAWERAFGGR